MTKLKNWVVANPDLAFAILLSVCVYGYFAMSTEFFATHRTGFAIMERFAVLGLVGLALTLCIIAGEIDLSIGSNAQTHAGYSQAGADKHGGVPPSPASSASAHVAGTRYGASHNSDGNPNRRQPGTFRAGN